jgi:hypothetical protein
VGMKEKEKREKREERREMVIVSSYISEFRNYLITDC